MAELHYKQLDGYLETTAADDRTGFASLYLVYGHEMLVKAVLDRLLQALLPDSAGRMNLETVDGDLENISRAVQMAKTVSLLRAPRVVVVRDARIFHASGEKARLLERARQAHARDDLQKAARYFLNLLGRLKLEVEDLRQAGIAEALGLGKKESEHTGWLEELAAYCREKQLAVPAVGGETRMLQAALEAGFPKNNHLVITTDRVDRRRELYRVMAAHGVIVDCSVPAGQRKADRQAQVQVLVEKMKEILGRRRKTMEAGAFEALYEKTGFDLRAFAGALEKLVDYTGPRPAITPEDVHAVVRRSRKDPIYELTTAVSNRSTATALHCLDSVLSDGFHPLQVLAALINQIRRLLMAKDFVESRAGGRWRAGCSYGTFRQQVLPAVMQWQQQLADRLSAWDRVLSGGPSPDAAAPRSAGVSPPAGVSTDLQLAKNPKSPYPVYQLLRQSDHFSREELISALKMLDEADGLLKTGGGPSRLVLERVLWRIGR